MSQETHTPEVIWEVHTQEDIVAGMVEVWEEDIMVEVWEEDIMDDKKPIRYYFWLVYYFIKNLPEIVCLYLYREYLYLKLIIIELFDL
jgi:hypothetical protein